MVGQAAGLGSIRNVPEHGWSDSVAAIPGYGYVMKDYSSYIRLYVVDYIILDRRRNYRCNSQIPTRFYSGKSSNEHG